MYTCSSENNDEEVNEEEEEEQEEHDDNEEDAEENKEDEEEGRGSAGKSVKRAVEGERFFSSLRVRADANGSLAGPPVCLTLSAKNGDALSLAFCDSDENKDEDGEHGGDKEKEKKEGGEEASHTQV